MTTDLITDPGVLVAAALLVAGVLAAGFAARLRVPGLLLFLGLGMLIGALGWIDLDEPEVAQHAAVVALLVILFAGGLTTKPTDLRRAAVPGLLLATVGVLVTAAVVAVAVFFVLGVTPLTAALIGAVVSSTDAAAVFAVVRKAPLPRRLMSLLEVESGTNDPVAIVLTLGVLEAWLSQPGPLEWVAFGVVQLGGGLAVGLVAGWVGSAAIHRLDLGGESLFPILALGLAGLAYGVAAELGASGFLAVYVAGLLVGVRVPRHRRSIRVFHEGLANVAEIGLFLVLGLSVVPTSLPPVALPALAITVILILLARPLAVALCMVRQSFAWQEKALVAWSGLRGAVPIVLATFPLTAGHPQGAAVFNIVFFVVLASTAVQGSTVGVVARLLGLRRGARVWAPVAEALPLDGVEVDLIEVDITEDLSVAGQRIRDVPLPAGALLAALVHGSQAIVPTGSTRLRPGDMALIAASRRPTMTAEVVAWARGEAPPDARAGPQRRRVRRPSDSRAPLERAD